MRKLRRQIGERVVLQTTHKAADPPQRSSREPKPEFFQHAEGSKEDARQGRNQFALVQGKALRAPQREPCASESAQCKGERVLQSRAAEGKRKGFQQRFCQSHEQQDQQKTCNDAPSLGKSAGTSSRGFAEKSTSTSGS